MALIWFFIAFFAFAMFLCACLTPIVRALALRFGLIDAPDGRRKLHTKPIPMAGGVAVLFASAMAVMSLFVFAGSISPILKSDAARGGFQAVVTVRPELIGLAIAAAIIGLVGAADDLFGLRGMHKFFGQLLAVSVIIFSGVQINSISIFNHTWDLGAFGVIVTAFWLLGAINSLNLIDGLDGMLSSIGCIICGSFAALAYLNGQWQAAFIATALSGSLLGFLFFNFPPATIFLGDCGSMLVGLVVGVLGIESSMKGAAAVSLAAPVALLVIPILDTSAAIVRRTLTGRSIFMTDRAHFHHRLMDRGLSNRQTLLLVATLSIIASAGAIASQALKSQSVALLSVVMVIGILVVGRLFGQAEFLLIKEQLLDYLSHWRRKDGAPQVRQHAVQLQGSANWGELWRNVTAAAEQMEFKTVCLDVNAPSLKEGYHARWGRIRSDVETPCYWRTEMPLSAFGQMVGRLEVVGMRNDESVSVTISRVAKLVEDLEQAIAGLTAIAAAPSLNLNSAADEKTLGPAEPARAS